MNVLIFLFIGSNKAHRNINKKSKISTTRRKRNENIRRWGKRKSKMSK